MREEERTPQAQTFAAGLEFLETNREQDNWYLQIETFDPHEPFFTLSSGRIATTTIGTARISTGRNTSA